MGVAGAGGALLALAGPPFDVTLAVWLGLSAFAIALMGVRGGCGSAGEAGRRALVIGTAFGFGACAVALRFVPSVVARFTPLPWAVGVVALLLLAVAQGLPWGFGALVTMALRGLRLPRAVAFATGVYAATFAPAVFPWTPAGLASRWPEAVQLADVVGERGVAFVIALTAGLLADAIAAVASKHAGARAARSALLPLLGAVALSGGVALYGVARIAAVARAPDGDAVSIALIAPEIPAEARWDPARGAEILALLTRLTRDAEARGAELTVWHETAYPFVLAASSRRCPTGFRALLGAGVHGPVLAGVVLSAGASDAYNAASVCGEGDVLSAPYAKRRLLAFGEAVPFASYAPWLRRIFARGLGLLPGDRNVVLTSGRVRASALICFEDVLTDAGRDAMGSGAADAPNLLVNLTNDAWFEGSAESELHLRLSALRAVETRRDFVRAVNVGPAAWIDAAGRLRARSDASANAAPSFLLVSPTLRDDGLTLFARFGDAPFAAALVSCVALWALNARRRARHRELSRRAGEREDWRAS